MKNSSSQDALCCVFGGEEGKPPWYGKVSQRGMYAKTKDDYQTGFACVCPVWSLGTLSPPPWDRLAKRETVATGGVWW